MAVLGLLIAALLVWPIVAPKIEQQFFPVPVAPQEQVAEPEPHQAVDELSEEETSDSAAIDAFVPQGEAAVTSLETLPEIDRPEATVELENEVVEVTVSSLGGSVAQVLLRDYRRTIDKQSPPVLLQFSPHPALLYSDLVGIDGERNLQLESGTSDRQVRVTGTLMNGLLFERLIELGNSYVLRVTDTFRNMSGQTVDLPKHTLLLGSMRQDGGELAPTGMYYLGVDALLHGGKGVQYYGKKLLPKALKTSAGLQVELEQTEPVDWLAVKNRYFVQILRPNDDTESAWVLGARLPEGKPVVNEVAGRISFPAYSLSAEQTFTRISEYYVGPKKFSILRTSSRHQTDVMEFGMFSPICKFLLWVLTFIHDKMWPHNYGIAIMLLTIIIRTIFWPITHKGTENMRKMQEIAPLMKEVKEKYKDKPERQQKAMLELYRENKVNPVGGCLPMLIQIPVFFSLFVVLRSAIEMRFAEFLWIQDLSEPENLFANVLPFGGVGLNILPILNAGSMWLQQKMTPATGDANQQKIMQFMPIVMLVLFYTFASGLVLYWTTNQVLMMTQQILYYRKREAQEKAEKG